MYLQPMCYHCKSKSEFRLAMSHAERLATYLGRQSIQLRRFPTIEERPSIKSHQEKAELMQRLTREQKKVRMMCGHCPVLNHQILDGIEKRLNQDFLTIWSTFKLAEQHPEIFTAKQYEQMVKMKYEMIRNLQGRYYLKVKMLYDLKLQEKHKALASEEEGTLA